MHLGDKERKYCVRKKAEVRGTEKVRGQKEAGI